MMGSVNLPGEGFKIGNVPDAETSPGFLLSRLSVEGFAARQSGEGPKLCRPTSLP